MDPNPQMPEMTQDMRDCINECLNCYAVCTQTVDHCLSMGGRHAEPRHIRTMLDCAEICRTSAGFMLRMSEFHFETCALCADICLACADSCSKFDDREMQRCAEVCRSCAASCQKMQMSEVE